MLQVSENKAMLNGDELNMDVKTIIERYRNNQNQNILTTLNYKYN